MIKVAQIGCGYWGPNLLRNFNSLDNCNVKYLVDSSGERRRFVEDTFPSISTEKSIQKILEDTDVNAVVIATPAGSHYELAKKVLETGKHVFVEKPLTTSVKEVDELAAIAESSNLTIMSGHTFLYNDAVRYIKRLIDDGSLGEVRYLYSQRLNLGRIRSDIDALWNFAPHDISIIQYLLGDPEPLEVTSHGMAFIQQSIDDVVFLNLRYTNVMANIHVSWLDPLKVRKLVVVGSEKMVVYDDVAEDKIAIYDKGIDKFSQLGENMDFDSPVRDTFRYRSGDILIPKIDYTEPLRREAQHFIDCIESGEEPLTGIKHSREVIGVLNSRTVKYKRNKRKLTKFYIVDLLLQFQFVFITWSGGFGIPFLSVVVILVILINNHFSRFADDQTFSISFMITSTYHMLLIDSPSYLMHLSFTLALYTPNFRSHPLRPFNVKLIIDSINKFISKVNKGATVLMAFSNPKGVYNDLFDGYRFLIDYLVYCGDMKAVHVLPDFSTIYETNYPDSLEFWGRNLSDVKKTWNFWVLVTL